MDIKTKEDRSRNMAAIRNKDTDIEVALRKALWNEGLRYRINYKLFGKPDIVFPGKKLVVFCDGCFWHGCPFCGSIPEQNKEFWETKIKKNIGRDALVTEQLQLMGWTVKRYWGCQIKEDLFWVVADILKNHV